MKLHLLRHAKTNTHSTTGLDFDRELLPRGYEQITALKTFLKAHPIDPKIILCSSAKRTCQTLAEIRDFWPSASIRFIDDLYLAEKEEILKLICAQNCSEEILVVGHNDGLSDLAMNLAHPPHALKTCGFISIEFPFESSAYISADTGSILLVFRVV
ncbi:MAG: SixA phosphatase family protein [Flavobacteriales bacterium]